MDLTMDLPPGRSAIALRDLDIDGGVRVVMKGYLEHSLNINTWRTLRSHSESWL